MTEFNFETWYILVVVTVGVGYICHSIVREVGRVVDHYIDQTKLRPAKSPELDTQFIAAAAVKEVYDWRTDRPDKDLVAIGKVDKDYSLFKYINGVWYEVSIYRTHARVPLAWQEIYGLTPDMLR